MKPNFSFLFLSFFTFSSAAIIQEHDEQILHEPSAISRVFENKQLRDHLFEMIDIDPSLRLVSKDFKKSHDQNCAHYLSKLDPRLRNYLTDIRMNEDDEIRHIPSRILPTLRLDVPLYYLFSKYLRPYSGNIAQPPAQIQNGEQDAFALRMANDAEGKRFITMVMAEFSMREFSGPFFPNTAGYLLNLYILLKNFYNPIEFAEIGFPTGPLLFAAVKGRFPDHYSEEIVKDFQATPLFVYEALKSGKVNLARIMLNKRGALDALATYTDPLSRMTTLHHCARLGAVDLIDRCLRMGANPFLDDSKRNRPMHYAAANGHYEAVRRLFQVDQNVFRSDITSSAPIVEAAENGHSDIIEFFLSQPNVTLIRDQISSNILAGIAIRSNNVRMAQVLFNSGKLELSVEIANRLLHLASRIE